MSRFVRASKYRHVWGQTGKTENNLQNVKVTMSAWDTNIVSASGKYISISWNASGGGAFAILPLPSPFGPIPDFPHKLPDTLPIARSHTAPVLDTDWSPHNDSIVASGAEDGKLLIWKVDDSAFEGWGSEGWQPQDFDPITRIDASPRKIGQVLFHPTASNVVASASGEHTVKLWDITHTDAARSVLSGHGDAIQSIAFNPTGTLLVSTCRDRKIRLFDPRAGPEAVRVADGHGGIKGSRAVWMGETGKIATTGFSKMSDRQVGIWDGATLANTSTITLDQSSGVVMPFWSDNNILFLAGKGDGNIRYYEYENDTLFALSEHKSSDPQRGMCFLPRRVLNVSDCEIARAFKVSGSTVEPIAFIVPRKSDSFQGDIFPPAPSSQPSLTGEEFFAGKPVKLSLVSLEDGAVSTSSAAATAPTPTPAASAPTPSPIAKVVSSIANVVSPPKEEKREASPPRSPSPIVAAPPAVSKSVSLPPASASAHSNELKEENVQLTAELREAREKIRNLELQVESFRANAKKAAALLQ